MSASFLRFYIVTFSVFLFKNSSFVNLSSDSRARLGVLPYVNILRDRVDVRVMTELNAYRAVGYSVYSVGMLVSR